jgi:hypothetical protein
VRGDQLTRTRVDGSGAPVRGLDDPAPHIHPPVVLLRSGSIACVLGVASFAPLPSGLPPADLVEQQAEPPRPGDQECGGDRIRGTWRATAYQRGGNLRWTFRIRRAGRALTGQILLTKWYGPRRSRPPPPCANGQLAFVVSQPAVGEVLDERRIVFRGTSWNLDRQTCGVLADYYVDNFVGRIDANASVMRVVNNDGHGAVNDPYVFRRVSCN